MNLQALLKEFGQRSQYLIQARLAQQIEQNRPQSDSTAWFTNKSKLQLRTGRLFKSFAPNSDEGTNELNISEKGFKLTIGSNLPYASIQEYGGFIKSKGRMHKYFWYKYAESRNIFFKILALSVIKRGGVNIPQRPYFNMGLQNFENKDLPELLEDFIEKFKSIYIQSLSGNVE